MTFDLDIIFKTDEINETTKNNYYRRLKTLNKKMEENNIKLRQYRRLMNMIKHFYSENLGTQNSYLSAWKKYLKISGKTKIKIFKEITETINENGIKIDKEHSKKQLAKIDKLKNVNYKSGIEKFINNITEHITEPELYLAFFLLIPTQRDIYHDMRFINDRKYNNKKNNFLLIKDDTYELIVNDYKTKKKYGSRTQKITNPVMKEILNKIKWKNEDNIFTYKKGTLKPKLRAETKKYFGIKLTIPNLRSLYASSSIDKETLKKLVKDAKDMTHSLTDHIKYYIV